MIAGSSGQCARRHHHAALDARGLSRCRAGWLADRRRGPRRRSASAATVSSGARLEPPRGRHRPEHRQPGRGGQGDVDPDDLGGSFRAHWTPPTAPCRARRPRTTPRGLRARLSPPGRLSSSQTPIAARPKTVAIAEWRWTTHSRVPVPSKSKRWTSCPAWAPAWGPEAVAIVPARIVSWPSGISARTAQTPRRSLGAPPLPRLVARAPGEGEGGVEEQHREDEVAHHQARRQVVLDDQGAEDRLAHHAQRQQRAEQRQVPAERAGGRRRARRRRSRRSRRSRSAAGCRTRSPRGCRAAAPCRRSTWASPGSRGPEPVSRTPAPVRTISARAAEGDQRHLRVELAGEISSRSRIARG